VGSANLNRRGGACSGRLPGGSDRGQKPPGRLSRQRGADPRVASLQRNIQFLQQQHKETLEKLHAETEYLRRQNKGEEGKCYFTLVSCTYLYILVLLYKPRPRNGNECQSIYIISLIIGKSIGEGSEPMASARQDHRSEVKGGLITSLQPLRIHSSPTHPPRAPTLQECEVIIRQLYHANSLQSQEVLIISIFTRSGPSQSSVVLPALKQSLSSTIAERQRRTRAVQRDRFKRTVQ
uniref:Uncharacterized protein n=1 Tax=Anabas testudineus TaxID=64144 RepID=A0A7N6AEE0_ANATE